ncbi:MAG: hypothetical protein ACXQTS_05355 [Candidatus Methanospirareceae archaeon]
MIMTFVLGILAIVSSLVFGYHLLKFIQADAFLWTLWIISWAFGFLFILAKVVEEE